MHKNQIYYVYNYNEYFRKDKEEDKLEKAANHTDLGNESDSSNDHLKVYEQDLFEQDL